jgi:ribosomal-protein-alanine N-acetyltransferase
MFLEVAKDNAPALALYERFGFAKVGERTGYYRRADGTRAAAAVMRKALR